jgi:membrane protease YdiL (CAAX protease family)
MLVRRVSKAALITSWVVILIVVAIEVALPYAPTWFPSLKPKPVAIDLPNPQLTLASRYLIGVQRMFSSMAGPTVTSLHKEIDENVSTPADRLRIIALDAELNYGGSPLDRLDDFLDEGVSDELRRDAQSMETVYRQGPDALKPAQRDALLHHHEWFGRLMLAYGKGGSDPFRQQVNAAAIRTVIGGITLLVVGGGLVLCGLAAIIVFIVFYAMGRFRFRYRAPPFFSIEYLQAFTLYMAGFLGGGILLRVTGMGARLGHLAIWTLAIPVTFAALWPRLRGASWAEWRYAFGWHFGRGFWREVGAGLVGYVAILPFYVPVAIVVGMLSKRFGPTPTNPVFFDLGKSGWAILNLYLVACVWAPITEESLFRGAFFHHLRGSFGFWVAGPVVALTFAAVHPYGWLGNNMILVLGFGLAAIRQWRSTLIPSITAHFLHNFIATTVAILLLT